MSAEADAKKKEPTPDEAAAHQFLTELRTRISTQRLPYQHGVEKRALESMWEVFGQARDAIRKNPGCEEFARRTTEVLNLIVRPLTAKWHRALEAGRLDGRDGADEFRGELLEVQEKLREFASELHEMAYGKSHKDALTPPVMSDADMQALFEPLAFGFTAPESSRVTAADAKRIADEEAVAVHARRKWVVQHPETKPAAVKAYAPTEGQDAVGLALSGGGIRSATFSLGVVQVLAAKGFLREVDFLSTVSGGGYTGCFLTQRLGSCEPLSDVAGPRGPDPEPVRYLRQRAKFLSADTLKDKWVMVTATLAGMLLNWCAPVLVILIFALGVHSLREHTQIHWDRVLIGGGILCVLATIAYGVSARLGRSVAMWSGRALGILLAATASAGLGWLLEKFCPDLIAAIGAHEGTSGMIGAAMAALVASIPTIMRFVPFLENPLVREWVLKVALWLAGLLVPLIAVLLFYTFRALATDHFAVLLVTAAILAVISFLVININLTGPHRLYRDGLARTFVQKTDKEGATDLKLSAINPNGTAPYHIINAALNIPASTDAALKDRLCDFFSFTKNWIGSPVVGYWRAKEWKTNGAEVDLATVMSISGAAFSSHMGLGSMPTLTALLTLLNVRLGFWIKKPPGGSWPGFVCLLREMTGVAMSEKRKWLNLSDGGHIENLGIYELLRRRCKFIICVDGEADPEFTFQGLMTVVRHAQIDFGIRIDAHLDDVRRDPVTGISKCHFHLCRIHYPEGIGLLLYLKLSVTGNESELVKRYRINHLEFPHQTTLDQFFDQEQFEAYRQLGVHVAEGLFLDALMDRKKPATVSAWFEQLARNLLEPVKD